MIQRAYTHLLNNSLQSVFFLTLVISMLIHLQFRKKHFQEVDSTLPYYLFQDFPNNCFEYANWSYVEDSSALSDFVIHQFIKKQSNELKISNEVIDAKAHFELCEDEFNFLAFKKVIKESRYCDTILLRLLQINPLIVDTISADNMRIHFNQTLDSTPYQKLFPNSFDSTKFTVNSSRLVKKAIAGEPLHYFEQAQINRAILEYFYPSAFTKLVVKEIKNRRLKLAYLWRILNIHRVIEWNANKYITASFQFSYSSTYFPGVGLIYYFILDHTSHFNAFFDAAQICTICLFHLSALLIVLTFLRMQFSTFASIASGTIFLFSITLYSYAHHLGSTIWLIFTSLVWLYGYTHSLSKKTKRQLYTISILSSILIFFNYLILLYWAAFMLTKTMHVVQDKSKLKLKQLFHLYLTQFIFALTTMFVIVFFYQPGQGNRGAVKSIAEFAYVFLNYFSFFNQNIFITLLQLIFIGACLFISIRSFVLLMKKKSTTCYFEKEIIHFILSFAGIYAITIITQQLGFAASRHVLWATPIFFLVFAYTFQHVQSKIMYRQLGIIITFIALGFWGLNLRQEQTVNNKKFDWYNKKNVCQYLVHDYLFEVYYNLKERHLPAVFTFKIAELERGKKYVFISQKMSFEDLMKTEAKELEKKQTKIRIINTEQIKSNVRFLAYSSGRFLQDIPNAEYVTEFWVL